MICPELNLAGLTAAICRIARGRRLIRVGNILNRAPPLHASGERGTSFAA